MTDLPFLDKQVQYLVTLDGSGGAYLNLGVPARDYPSLYMQNKIISIARAHQQEHKLSFPCTLRIGVRTSFSVGI